MNKATGEPILDEIANKGEYHWLDALRYVLGSLAGDYAPSAGEIITDIHPAIYKSKRTSIWD